MKKSLITAIFIISVLVNANTQNNKASRAGDIGVKIGILDPGTYNAITDVKGVKVGHFTLHEVENIRTGVTVILPHSGNLFQHKVPAAIYLANGFGKLTGYSQVEELGNIETPIVLTNTLSVPAAADALISYTLSLPGNENVRSVNPVVGETNDGWLNDIRGRHVKERHVLEAIKRSGGGIVDEGNVGAGTGTISFGFKGGIGTASRVIPETLGGYTVGVLVQSNFGGVLEINGAPVGKELGRHIYKDHILDNADGSCMIVVATDAPLCARNLKRLAKRAMLGLAKTGGISSNGSGDYVIAFSVADNNLVKHQDESLYYNTRVLRNENTSPLFMAVIEATEEAILNSMFAAETMTGRNNHVIEELPMKQVLEILHKYNKVDN